MNNEQGENMNIKIPEALYGCACFECATEVSYPPDMLFLVENPPPGDTDHAEPGFYCHECIDEMPMIDEDTIVEPGISLKLYLALPDRAFAE